LMAKRCCSSFQGKAWRASLGSSGNTTSSVARTFLLEVE
jgi:hypothetical protein